MLPISEARPIETLEGVLLARMYIETLIIVTAIAAAITGRHAPFRERLSFTLRGPDVRRNGRRAGRTPSDARKSALRGMQVGTWLRDP
jgi:hypothetical protein